MAVISVLWLYNVIIIRMLFEHLIYSTAIAIIAGMIHLRKKGRDYSWIIIASAMAPDLDMFAGYIFSNFNTGILINGNALKHGDFHNILVLFFFAVLVGLLLKSKSMNLKNSFIFAGIGFIAHILEDVLVYNPGYAFLWPLSSHVFGIGIVNYVPDWYGIANTGVLIAGVIIMILCGTIRTLYEGKSGLHKTIKAIALAGVLLTVTIPAVWFYQVDENFKDEVIFGNFVDGWRFTRNASWDSTVSYNGSYSARIEILGNESKKSDIWRSNVIPVKQKTNYTFSLWGKTLNAGGGAPMVRVVELDSNKKWIRQNNLFTFSKGTNDWAEKQIIFQTLLNTSYIYVYANIWEGYGTFWVDDVELYEEGVDQNIIMNSGFENGVRNIIEIGSLNKYGQIILIFMAVISFNVLKEENKVGNEELKKKI